MKDSKMARTRICDSDGKDGGSSGGARETRRQIFRTCGPPLTHRLRRGGGSPFTALATQSATLPLKALAHWDDG